MSSTSSATERASTGGPLLGPGLSGGLSIAIERFRRRGFALAVGLAFALTVVAGLVERRVGGNTSVDRTLGVVFSWAIPLTSLAVVSLAISGLKLRDATWPVARFGAPRSRVALGLVGAAMLVSAVVSMVLSVTAVAVAHRDGGASLPADLATSAWIGALTGAAYAAWLSLGASFGRFGGGRNVILALDFVLGRTDVFGVVFPRGNAANLLGFSAPLELGQRASSALLAGFALVVLAVASWRSRD